MAIGSRPFGRCEATLIDPPTLPAGAEPLAPGDALPPPVLGAAPLALVLGELPPQATMIDEMAVAERPTRIPRLMNSRRLNRPCANDSTTSSWSGVVERRTSSRER